MYGGHAVTQSKPDGADRPITLTHFRATDDSTLVKSFSIGSDGAIRKTSHAQFSLGVAWKTTLESGLVSLPQFIDDLEPTDCLATGVFDKQKVRVIPQGKSIESDDSRPVRHRTKEAMRQPEPGLALLDHDHSPCMPDTLRCATPTELMHRITKAIPAFKEVGWVGRGSSSQGILNEKTGESYAATAGIHVYIAANTSDLDALKRDLEVALWRAGLGYVEFARNGRRLLRTIIDLSVLSPERLIFEAAPTLGPGVGRVAPSWERFDG